MQGKKHLEYLRKGRMFTDSEKKGFEKSKEDVNLMRCVDAAAVL